ALDHGVPVRPVCVNASRWDCTLEPAGGPRLAVRQGLRMVQGLSEDDGTRLAAVRPSGGYSGLDALWRRTGLPARTLRRLAAADAFRG
ncbi:helix-hairpin-helix domain-containing protein, partial [Escherichia coli]